MNGYAKITLRSGNTLELQDVFGKDHEFLRTLAESELCLDPVDYVSLDTEAYKRLRISHDVIMLTGVNGLRWPHLWGYRAYVVGTRFSQSHRDEWL